MSERLTVTPLRKESMLHKLARGDMKLGIALMAAGAAVTIVNPAIGTLIAIGGASNAFVESPILRNWADAREAKKTKIQSEMVYLIV